MPVYFVVCYKIDPFQCCHIVGIYVFKTFLVIVFSVGLYEMRDCYMPINEAKRCQGEKINIQAEIRILEEDVFMHQCMAEAMQAISIGEPVFPV